MKAILYSSLIILCFISCKKKSKKHYVTYKITVLHGSPSYSVQYSSFNNTTQTQSAINSSSWTSPSVDDRKTGSTVSLTLEGGRGGSYEMYIIIDGYIEKEGRMDDPYGPATISAVISD